MGKFWFATVFAALTIGESLAFAQAPVPNDPLSYADIADLSDEAPIILKAVVTDSIKVKPERAPGLKPGMQRLFVEARIESLIRSDTAMPAAIRYIVDMSVDARGKVPKIKKQPFLVFARSGAGAGELQLVALDGQLPWTPERETKVRSVVRELVALESPASITRIVRAFHVPGTVVGEGETQIFLQTTNNAPISITIINREGQRPIWAVSLSEIVDEAARPPVRGSLLWYRLACFLPKSLPQSVLGYEDSPESRQARNDYAMVMRELGACPRSRNQPVKAALR